MKKLLVMLVVLVMAGASYGTMVQPVEEGTLDLTTITVDPSDDFYIDLVYYYTGAAVPGNITAADVLLKIDGPASFLFNDPTVHDMLGGTAAGQFNGQFAMQGGLVISGTSWASGAAPGSVIFDHIGLHCDGPGEVTITAELGGWIQGGSFADFWDWIDLSQGGSVLGSMTVIQTPEPVTIGLLGLGGLALLRRRR